MNLVLKPIQFILLLTIFLGAKRIKTMLHKIFQNYWTYIYLIVDINPIQIIIDLIQMPKLNVSETPKILVWKFSSCQYFQRITGTFSWTHLRRFNCWLFLEVSEALKNPQFKFQKYRHDAHMEASTEQARARDVTVRKHTTTISTVANPFIFYFCIISTLFQLFYGKNS